MKIIPNTKYYSKKIRIADHAFKTIIGYFIVWLLINFFNQMPELNTWNYKDHLLTLMEFEILLIGGIIIWSLLVHGLLLFRKILYYLVGWATCENVKL